MTQTGPLAYSDPVEWSLPPRLPWPQFLRLLRHPSPPKGWLEEAAEIPEVRKRPALLRWIAQHRKASAHLRVSLLPRLSIQGLCDVSDDASAHPQARAMALERLQSRWNTLSLGERRAMALRAPRPLWPGFWKVPELAVLERFLQNPKLNVESVLALIQAPLSPVQAEALARSSWRKILPVAHHVLQVVDQTLRHPEGALVLGHAAPWIRSLNAEERQSAIAQVVHPVLRRMLRASAEKDSG